MNNTISFQDQDTKTQKEDDEEEDQEEALSFCDFPLNPNEPEKNNSYSETQSSSQPSDLFEFFNDLKSKNISHAEDIISCGKLVPYKQQPPPDLVHHQILIKSISGDYDSTNSSRRSCESLPELNPTRSNSSSRLTRGSRSLDSRKLRRNSSMVVVKSRDSDIERSSSKGSTKSEGSKVLKPRWYALMFGSLVKFPPEMDLRDMKNRQVRRNTGSMFPAEGSFPANRRSSWGHDLLRVLSCKNHASVTVTAS